MIIPKKLIDENTLLADNLWEEIIIKKQEENPLTWQSYIKMLKRDKILNIATLTDQLNLIAWILAEQIEAKPETERTDLEKKALTIYKEIQNILNWNI